MNCFRQVRLSRSSIASSSVAALLGAVVLMQTGCGPGANSTEAPAGTAQAAKADEVLKAGSPSIVTVYVMVDDQVKAVGSGFIEIEALAPGPTPIRDKVL